MMPTMLVAFGAVAVAAIVGALLALSVPSGERPFMRSQCGARLAPIARSGGRPRPS